MFCPNCGNQMPDTAAFCTKCGTRAGQPAAAPADDQTQPAAYQPPAQPASRDEMLATQRQAYSQPPAGGSPQPVPQYAPQTGAFSASDCISQGWAMVKPHIGLFFIGSIVYFLLCAATGFIPGASFILGGPLMGGFYIMCFRPLNGEKPEIGDLFKGFSRFVPLLLVYIVMCIFIGIGMVLLIIPGIYLLVAYTFAIPLVLDQNMDFWEAMETSRKTVGKCWGSIFGLLVLNFLICLLGML